MYNVDESLEPLDLYWDSTYAIVVSLMEQRSDLDPEEVGLKELAEVVAALPGFKDDQEAVTERMLLDILTVWVEEATNP